MNTSIIHRLTSLLSDEYLRICSVRKPILAIQKPRQPWKRLVMEERVKSKVEDLCVN